MSAGSSTQPAAAPTDTGRRRRLPRLRDARIRTKLALILVVPLAAVLGLATLRLVDVGERAYDARRVEQLTRLSVVVTDLTRHVHRERMAAATLVAAPVDGEGARAAAAAYRAAVAETDRRITAYLAARRTLGTVTGLVKERLAAVDGHLGAIDATRKRVLDRGGIAVGEVVLRYGVVVADLTGYGDATAPVAGDDAVARDLRALAAFARAEAGTAEQEAVAYAGLVSGDTGAEHTATLIAAQVTQQQALTEFSAAATPAQRDLVAATVTGDAVERADAVSARLRRGEKVPPAEVQQSFGAVVDLMRGAEQELERRAVDAAARAATTATRQAWLEAGVVALVLLLALVLAVAVVRSLNRSLRTLRDGALGVANRDLPDVVARLRDAQNLGSADAIVRDADEPIRLGDRDEVGQVAQAFNAVHHEAVRIAAEQAALRTSVSTMFLNLARRSQSLVDRMIGELDQIERGEEDPKRLAQLFELDHLATRMRRNDENLLVLAGADSGPPRREDALLVDVLRAAQSEVELYNRVEFGTVDTDVAVSAPAVNDVVRLVAELLDNATRFSPPDSVVVADGRRVRDTVVVQIEDRGLGMSEEQLESLNARLAQPPGVDVAVFRLMGLAVVARLAARYGVRVELRANLEGGTVAQVILPAGVAVPVQPLEAPGREEPAPVSGPPARGPGRAVGPPYPLPALVPGPRPRAVPALGSTAAAALAGGTAAAALAGAARTGAGAPSGDARPPLPVRVPRRPDTDGPSTAPSAAPDAAPERARPAAGREPRPAVTGPPLRAAVDPAASDALGSPTVAYPTLPAADRAGASGPLPTLGFVTTDGVSIAVTTHPVSPAPSTWDGTGAPASWFAGDGAPSWSMPTAGYAPPPFPRPAPAPGSGGDPAPDVPAAPDERAVPRPRQPVEDSWHTAADDGWQRALAAAEPPDAGTTRSGLPKRVPQAQLVPGAVQGAATRQVRRTPDNVRGLLATYRRGVQRGRVAGAEETGAVPATSTKETDQ